MKYFTKEWYHDSLVAQMCFQVRKDAKAAKASDKYFESLYSMQLNWFVKHMKRAARHTKTEFDRAAAEAEFRANYEENLNFVSTSLPAEILEKIADLRVLALGCAEQDILLEITRYCGQVDRKCKKICDCYEEENEKLGDKLGWYKLASINKLLNAPIVSVDTTASNLWTLETSPEITEIGCKLTLIDSQADPSEAEAIVGATILYLELLPTEDDKFMTLSLLCEQKNGELIELSATVTDFEVVEI